MKVKMQKHSVTVWRKGMPQGQGNHCSLFRRQSEWWLAAIITQGANSVVWLPCSRLCLALKAGSPILLVYLEGLRVQGLWTHANLTRNRGLNQNVELLFSNKSCTSQGYSALSTKALPSLCAHLWESQIIGHSCTESIGPVKGVGNNLQIWQPQALCLMHNLDCREGSSLCHTNSLAYDRVGVPLPDCVFPEFAFIEIKYGVFVKVNWVDYIVLCELPS